MRKEMESWSTELVSVLTCCTQYTSRANLLWFLLSPLCTVPHEPLPLFVEAQIVRTTF